MTNTNLTHFSKTDLLDAIADLKGMIQVAARRPGSGKVAEIADYRFRKMVFEAELATR